MDDTLPRLEARDRAMLDQIDAVFDRVREQYPGALPCSRGCSYCCVAFFDITALDVWRLREGLRRLEPGVRAAVIARARHVVEATREAVPGWEAPYDVRDIGDEAFTALARRVPARCPALGRDGECLVYAHRPRICHLQGLSYVDPEAGIDLPDFCADTFGDEDYASIPPQPLALCDQWEQELELRQAVSEALPPALGGGYRTFVAAAVVVLGDDGGVAVGRRSNATCSTGNNGEVDAMSLFGQEKGGE